ncbi:hypothetical protein A3C26_03165 [Candidatus Daviesbacteria bacterium RIFCSPHIGHO2_02_FULL_39_12]|uniref:Uncharacterized protein n=2 Tax=Candidatus Daviesiibacteriota TaxID=1752718 RepID=A0A1F5JE37_9BACT|nr:MAG: hypothetical protein A3C26_03165 [Candidatus Daviesbacteria bacterium RIFCSPHIGHO2_02_FULL_39_12]OGE71415.1 MAG: hypothetical protein A3H40_02715 [Candidatus Daviesbacteria bacterium RIFCSPLOWO2_02_FULL_38_15]
MTIEADKISAIRFTKKQEDTGLSILVQNLGRVDLWSGGFKHEDPIIATVKTDRLNGVFDKLRQAQVVFQIQTLAGDLPGRTHQLWERLEGWDILIQKKEVGSIEG